MTAAEPLVASPVSIVLVIAVNGAAAALACTALHACLHGRPAWLTLLVIAAAATYAVAGAVGMTLIAQHSSLIPFEVPAL